MKTAINFSEKAAKSFENFMTQDQKGSILKRIENKAVCPFEDKEVINISYELRAIGEFTIADIIHIGRLLERIGE